MELDYPLVYDKFETDFSGLGIAILEKAKNIRVRKVINGEIKLYLVLPHNDPKWKYIQAENFIRVKGQNYRIRTFEPMRDAQGRLLSNIQAEHVWYDANDCKYIPKLEMVGASPRSILEAAFSGTRFTVGNTEISTLTDIFLSKTNPAKVAQELIRLVGGELIRDNWTVHLVSRIGNAKGMQIRIGKNLTSVKKITDGSGLITRLFPYGKDDLDITSVNAGIAYLDSQYINNYDYIHQHPKDYKDIEDPGELKTEALKEFSTPEKDGIDKPKVTYSAEVAELKKLIEYGRFEEFAEGDTVRIIDEDLNIDVNARVMEYEEYPFEALKSNVVLANFRDNLGNWIADLDRNKQNFDRITDSKGNIKADYVEYLIGKLSTEINAALGSKKVVIHETGDIWVDSVENPTKAMAIVNGMYAIANSKKPNGDWNWRVLATGDKLVADEVIANWVYAGKVTASQIDVSGGKILASQIETSELVVGTNIAMGPYAYLSWMNITGKPDIGQEALDRINATYMDASGVWTPNVYATHISTLLGKIATAQIENLEVGRNVLMGANAYISWANVNNKPYIPTQYTDSMALSAIQNTYIDSNGVWTPAVYADRLYGNYITGKTIRTAADGSRLSLSGSGLTSYNGSNLQSGWCLSADTSWNNFDLYINGVRRGGLYYEGSSIMLGANSNTGGAPLILFSQASDIFIRPGSYFGGFGSVYPGGNWDFSGASVTGLNIIAKFA